MLLATALSLGLLASCGKDVEVFPPLATPQADREAEAESLLKSDPKGPIPKPSIPPGLGAGADPGEAPPVRPEKIEYTLEVLSEELPEAGEIFLETAELATLREKPIFSRFLLGARLRSGISTGQDILNSLGYYDGVCDGSIETIPEAPGTKVVIRFTPGTQYTIGKTQVLVAPAAGWAGEEPPPPSPAGQGGYPDIGLKDVGLKEGDPAVASKVIAAVDLLADLWGDRGYPDATLSGTRYTLDKSRRVLEVEATIDPGEFTRMGALVITGDNPVKPGFIENSINWEYGQPWNETLVERFQDTLFQKGIFKPMVVERSKERHDDGTRDLILDVQRAPLRTVSGSLNYDSDFGPGVDIAWEHRNLTHWGDRFRVEVPVWKDLQQLGLQYTRPYFLSKRQNLLAKLSLLNEKADSYRLKSMSAAVGVERQLSRNLLGTLQVTLERGRLDEFMERTADYSIVGFPLTLDWNWANDLLDPTTGHRLKITAAPYYGHYTRDFQVVKTRLDADQYFSLKKDGYLVAAFRLSLGAIFGDDADALPTSMRFFSGGGGSVRGYRYQSIGPLNRRGRPAGGDLMTEASAELRWRFKESMGVTLFVDGGMLYDEVDMSYLGKDLLFGGGLGFRYYTPVGPFRVDIATPLNPREHDPKVQLYISLGQSF